MEKSKVPPLKAIPLPSRPLTSHAITWSCDAELAVAGDDELHIFLPHFSSPIQNEDVTRETALDSQFSLSLRVAVGTGSDPAINTQLFASAGLAPPPRGEDHGSFSGVGSGVIAGSGSAISQAVSLEWSPSGLGRDLRPVLAVLLTHGGIAVLGEESGAQASATGLRTRNFKTWKWLWGLGARLPLPDPDADQGFRVMDERITSFSWARELFIGKALLAYLTDAGDVVIMAVEHAVESAQTFQPATKQRAGWQISEVARFNAKGPHRAQGPLDPDFVPHGSAFSLSWSPWVRSGESMIATLAYTAKNYVGFRRIRLEKKWPQHHRPRVVDEGYDILPTCVYLSSDAFVQWEDTTWSKDGLETGRGVIGTPFEIKPFEVALSGAVEADLPVHSTRDCETLYPKVDGRPTNPITGVIVHQPDTQEPGTVPLYSLVRLSATATNHDWFQTNTEVRSNELPQWVGTIQRRISRMVPRLSAVEVVDSDFSDDSEEEDQVMEEGEGGSQVHAERFQLLGLASSPMGMCTAALVSRHSTQYPQRRRQSWILFSTRQSRGRGSPQRQGDTSITTEGRVWEWMYNLDQGNLGTDLTEMRKGHSKYREPENTQFEEVLEKVAAWQSCVFCDMELEGARDATSALCKQGHRFARCATTGLAIMAPGISRLCDVCGLRSLKIAEVTKILEAYYGSNTEVPLRGLVCGTCGGKFVA